MCLVAIFAPPAVRKACGRSDKTTICYFIFGGAPPSALLWIRACRNRQAAEGRATPGSASLRFFVR